MPFESKGFFIPCISGLLYKFDSNTSGSVLERRRLSQPKNQGAKTLETLSMHIKSKLSSASKERLNKLATKRRTQKSIEV